MRKVEQAGFQKSLEIHFQAKTKQRGLTAVTNLEDEEDEAVSEATGVSVIMEPISESARAALVSYFLNPTIKQEQEEGPQAVCYSQPNQRRPTHTRHFLSGELLLLQDIFTKVPVRDTKYLRLLGKGQNRVTYELDGQRVLKLANSSHGSEAGVSRSFGTVTARVYWEGWITVGMYHNREFKNELFYGLVQERALPALGILPTMDAHEKAEFFWYLASVFTWIEARGVVLKDIGPSNVAVANRVPPLRVRLYDLQSWEFGQHRRSRGDEGFLRLVGQFSPEVLEQLRAVWNPLRLNYPARFLKCAENSPSYHSLLREHQCMSSKGTLSTYFNPD
ncbi:unnamed protein product [Symbiodinium sp. CCMP2592]|nr:unnamed protein product [Symbiodinium sp. CCMP2592]